MIHKVCKKKIYLKSEEQRLEENDFNNDDDGDDDDDDEDDIKDLYDEECARVVNSSVCDVRQHALVELFFLEVFIDELCSSCLEDTTRR